MKQTEIKNLSAAELLQIRSVRRTVARLATELTKRELQ
jgi:ribosomal protein L29